jgi:hypothetical protein
LASYLRIEDVDHADYIFISHAHFDHLPGCDRLAKKTGAIVVANGEAINMLREAGVADEQLLPVAGGERIPLFTRDVWEAARKNEIATAPGPPGAPLLPDSSLAAMDVHAVSFSGLVYSSAYTYLPVAGASLSVTRNEVNECFPSSALDTNDPCSHADLPDTMDTAAVYEGSSSYACTIDITRGMSR